MDNNEIIKIYGLNYKENTKILLEASKLSEDIDKKKNAYGKGDSFLIGIKPNLVSPSEASYGATTHPEIVAGIIEYLKEHGHDNIIMLEGSWVGDQTSESVEVCGYDVLSKEYQVPFVDMQKDSYKEYDCKGVNLYVCNSAISVNYMINVPVLKGHCQTKITCALKNMKGLIPNTEKRKFHKMGLHKPIAHLSTKIHQDFIVVDHICGDLDFEDGGNPVERNYIISSKDPVLMDSYVCKLLDYDVKEVPYIVMAEELGVGSTNLSQAIIKTIDESGKIIIQTSGQKEDDTIPSHKKIVEIQDYVQEVESCSACYGYLMPALDQLKREGYLDQLEDKIQIGQGYQGKAGKLGVGRCTKDFDFCVMGCPPTEEKIYEELKQYILEKKNSKEFEGIVK